MSDRILTEGIAEYIPPMTEFLNKHVGPKAKDQVNISNIRDIEETIWSPRYAGSTIFTRV